MKFQEKLKKTREHVFCYDSFLYKKLDYLNPKKDFVILLGTQLWTQIKF